MKCFTCDKQVTLTLDETADEQRDAFAKKHDHNPDWVRWLRRNE